MKKLKPYQQGGKVPLLPISKPTITLGRDNTTVVPQPLLSAEAVAKLRAEELKKRKLKLSNQKRIYKEKGELSKEGIAASAIGEKARLFPNDPDSFFDDYLNPAKMIGDMADNLGRAFFDPNSTATDKAMAVGIPLGVGALGGLGAKSNSQFVNNLVNPLAGTGNVVKSVNADLLKRMGLVDEFTTEPIDWLSKWNNDPINIAKQEAYRKADYNNVYKNKTGKKYFIDKNGLVESAMTARERYPFREVSDAKIGNYFDLAREQGIKDYLSWGPRTAGLSYSDGSVYINRAFPKADQNSTVVHELTHNFEHNGGSLGRREREHLLEPFDIIPDNVNNKLFSTKKKYYTDPTEIHARMNQVRYDQGLKPGDEFTKKNYDQAMKKNNFFGMGKYIEYEDDMIKLMNKFYTPAALATGATATLEASDKKKYGGSIHINPANKGKFTASASAAGMGVQEFASHVLANKEDYSSTQVKRANFAKNASKFKHQAGGPISTQGYKADSPDRFNDYNIIPSGNITMNNVNFPVFGIDNLGNQQMMYPGQDYNFPGNSVTEYPMKKKNGGIVSNGKKLAKFLESFNTFHVTNSPTVDMFDPTIFAQMGTEVPNPYDQGITPFYDYNPGFVPPETNNPAVDNQPARPKSNKLSISDYLKNQGANKIMNRATSNLVGDFVDPSSLYNTLGTVEAGVNYFGNQARNRRQQDWLIDQRNSDQLFPTQPGGDRGEYVTTGSAYGQFRPDQLGAKSPYGMQGMYYPSMQMGGPIPPLYTTPRGNEVTAVDLAKVKEATGIDWRSPQEYGAWLDKFATPLITPSKNTVKYPYGKRGEVMTQDEWDYSRKKRGYPDVYADKVQGTDNFIPGEIFSNEVRNDVMEFRKKNKMEYGGQNPGNGYALQLNNGVRKMASPKGESPISKTLQPVDEEYANIEAELGETIFGDFDNDGINEHMKVGGKKHSQGGTPLAVPGGSFVFSDTKRMKIGGEILESFGKNKDTKKVYTPAELAKQYDVNKYKEILDNNKDVDPIVTRTAEMMIENYNNKLGKLALVQEGKKGFPNGIPQIAVPYLMGQVAPSELENTNVPNNDQMFAIGGEVYNPWENYDPATGLPIDPYKGGRTAAGTTTPTGKQNPYNRKPDHLTAWENIIPGIRSMRNDQAQGAMYDYNLKNNPNSIKEMWSTYGLTAKGLKDKKLAQLANKGVLTPDVLTPDNLNRLRSAYTDNFFGVRQMDPVAANIPTLPDIPTRTINPTPPSTTPIFRTPSEVTPNPFTAGTSRPQEPTDFWTQDKLNAIYALQNKANLTKYLPWAAPVIATTADPTFYDPNRELAANAEQMNTEMMYNAQFSGPQSLGARNSAVAGSAASNAANILSKYNNMNVGVANEYSGANAAIMNQLSAAQAARANNLYQGNVIANQQYDNSRAQSNDVIRRNLVGALDNQQKTGWINSWYPQFDIDPGSGSIGFQQGSGRSTVTPGGGAARTYLDVFKQLKRENPNVPDEVLREQAKQMTGTATNTVTSDGDLKSVYKGPTPQQLMQMLKGQ